MMKLSRLIVHFLSIVFLVPLPSIGSDSASVETQIKKTARKVEDELKKGAHATEKTVKEVGREDRKSVV